MVSMAPGSVIYRIPIRPPSWQPRTGPRGGAATMLTVPPFRRSGATRDDSRGVQGERGSFFPEDGDEVRKVIETRGYNLPIKPLPSAGLRAQGKFALIRKIQCF